MKLRIVLGSALLAVVTPPAVAQFEADHHIAGVNVGLSGRGSTVAFGLDYEYAVTDEIGIGALLNMWKYDFSYPGFASGFSYSYTALAVTGSYHFRPDDTRWDPFAGIALGYYFLGVTTPPGTFPGLHRSRGFVGAHAGVRYFIDPKVAAQARVGFGSYIFVVGIDVKI